MSYNLTLANKVPAASAFKVMVNSSARSVSAVTVSGTKVMLTLSAPVVYGNSVTVSYTKPSVNPLQTSAGSQAATISAQNVKNNLINPVNAAPAIAITSPVSNSTFTSPANIAFTATASDADWTISLVEFFNGTTLLGSKASAPYTVTWSNVLQGTFTITAVAADNRGSKIK